MFNNTNKYICCLLAKSCQTLCKPMDCSVPDFPVLHYILEFAQTHVHWVSDAIQPFHPLPSPFLLPSIFPSVSLFQWVGSSHQVSKVLELQLQHQSFNDYSGLISLRIDWFHILATQAALKSLLQHHSLKASILHCQPSLGSNSHIHTWLLEKP